MTVRALIAEDEQLLREHLKKKLAQLWPELEIVAEAADGVEAVEMVEAHKPQVAFLDIHMPEMTGLQAAAAIGNQCHVVFVTAYDQYALEAFEKGAVDYIVKPVKDDRLSATIGRLKARLASPPADLSSLLKDLARTVAGDKKQFLRWIRASQGNTLKMIAVDDVLFFDADSKYTRVVTNQGESLIRTPLKELTDELDPDKFWQIHRSTIVNVNAIASVTRDFRGDATIKLAGSNETLRVSRAYSHLFKQM